jgi:hypothetical protein
MLRTGILPALLVLVLSIGLVSGAEARKWRWWFSFGSHAYSARSGEDDGRRARAAQLAESTRAKTGGGAFGAVVDRLIRGCGQQAVELQNWPFDAIAKIASPDDTQRRALDQLRATAADAAERLRSDCPLAVPAAPAAQLEAVEQAIDAGAAAFTAVQPSLEAFYAALDDEQKARLLRDMTLSDAQARGGERSGERSERRSYRRRAYASADRNSAVNQWAAVCEDLTAALRGWPIREIERNVGLSETQRVAFYELVTSSLKAADTLVNSCPSETALTPVGRMKMMRARLAAVRQATVTIRTSLVRFYEALDNGQKVRFAGMR